MTRLRGRGEEGRIGRERNRDDCRYRSTSSTVSTSLMLFVGWLVAQMTKSCQARLVVNDIVQSNHVTIRCGADRKRTRVVRAVYKLSPIRQNLSITMAANFQSLMIRSSSSFSLSRRVSDLSSFSIIFTSAERKETKVVLVRLCLLQQQQWWWWSDSRMLE